MTKTFNDQKLTAKTFQRGIAELTKRDADLAKAVARWGNPPLWVHPPGFAGIVIAILSQQVSLESAQATFAKLEKTIGSINPENFLALNDSRLRKIGFSRQKASYVQGVAHDLTVGAFDIDALASMDNPQARKRLIEVRGIGAWTADTYLLFALRRSDAWPTGDLALVRAVRELKAMPAMPSFKDADSIAEQWRPWRAVAARILWHYYLRQRGRAFSA